MGAMALKNFIFSSRLLQVFLEKVLYSPKTKRGQDKIAKRETLVNPATSERKILKAKRPKVKWSAPCLPCMIFLIKFKSCSFYMYFFYFLLFTVSQLNLSAQKFRRQPNNFVYNSQNNLSIFFIQQLLAVIFSFDIFCKRNLGLTLYNSITSKYQLTPLDYISVSSLGQGVWLESLLNESGVNLY